VKHFAAPLLVRLDGGDLEAQQSIDIGKGVLLVGADREGPNALAEHEDLLPGDQLIVTAARPATRHKADVAKATSWREGQIIFDDDTLGNAVAEINRYSMGCFRGVKRDWRNS